MESMCCSNGDMLSGSRLGQRFAWSIMGWGCCYFHAMNENRETSGSSKASGKGKSSRFPHGISDRSQRWAGRELASISTEGVLAPEIIPI
jgi:hypothetical protein